MHDKNGIILFKNRLLNFSAYIDKVIKDMRKYFKSFKVLKVFKNVYKFYECYIFFKISLLSAIIFESLKYR